MIEIDTEYLLTCDVDETLIGWDKVGNLRLTTKGVDFIDPYDGFTKQVIPQNANIKILKNHLERGATVIVWSKSGYKWAKAALKAVNINHPRIFISPKPIGYIDDKPCQEWMGERIFLPPGDPYGQ